MFTRLLIIAAAAALAAPVAAHAQPTRFQVQTDVEPGERAALTIGKVPRGEFRYFIAVTGNGERSFGITQQRGVAPRFPVLNVPSPFADNACRVSATRTLCLDITTPAWLPGSTYTIRLKNKGTQTIAVNLTVLWRPVTSAG